MPIKQRHYPVSRAVEKLLYEELDRMLDLGVIEECEDTSWSSPVTLVRKQNGKVRLCLDARKVNEVTEKDAFPLPLINGLLSRLENTKYISSIDLKDAFWQIPLDDDAKRKTAFTVPGRPLYRFRVMPFGLCNAPQTMCRLMHKVVPYRYHDKIFVYLDDLLVTSSDLDEHLGLLRLVSLWLREANLTINVAKSKFVLKELKYLGHIIGDGCIKVDPEKVSGVTKFPVPKSVKELRRFLGMTGWYRRFIPNYASVTAPLTDLLKKKTKLIWSEKAQESMEKLQYLMTTAPVLMHPDYNLPFYIQVDASSQGVGGVLFQKPGEEEHPIAYYSKKLNPAQRKYCTTELECYAAILCVKAFRHYVEGFKFTIITDHASLRWLMTQTDLSGRLARWSLKLQGFNFDIQYRKGALNVVPDALSRAFCEVLNQDGSSGGLDNGMPHLDLNSPAFCDDQYLAKIRQVQQNANFATNLRVENGKLLISPAYGERYLGTDISPWKLVVPTSLTLSLIEQAHVPPSSSHMGIHKTVEKLQRYFFWTGMANQVREYIKSCQTCKMSKAVNYSTRPPMGDYIEVKRPFQRIFLDFLGPYPRSRTGNCYILIMLDQYSRFILLKSLREASAASLCDFLENEVFHVYSVPESVFTDNGKQFKSNLFANLLARYGVQHTTTPFHSPQSNASERANRTILAAIRSYVNENHTSWDLYLPQVASTLRNVIHSATSYSPHFLVFGQHFISHGSDYEVRRLLNCEDDNAIHAGHKANRLELAQPRVLRHLKLAYLKGQKQYDTRSQPREFIIGQQVFVRTYVQSDAIRHYNAKLAPKFIPAIITGRVGNVVYNLVDAAGKSLGTYHAKDIIK